VPDIAAQAAPALTLALAALTLLGQVALCLLIADALSGLLHWIEDSYFSPNTPLIGRHVIAPNIEHHLDPRAFLRNSWWDSTWISLLIAAVLGLAIWASGLWHWTVALTLLIAAHAATVHKWAHRSRSENGPLIVALQRLHIIQSPAHHAAHHRPARDRRYCVITPWVNPIVDRLHLWHGLELAIQFLFRVAPRPEPDEASWPATKAAVKHTATTAAHSAVAAASAASAAAGAAASAASTRLSAAASNVADHLHTSAAKLTAKPRRA
jgi:hypothetical protein